MTTMFQKLAAPFPPAAIHWRAQNLTKDGTKALALAYLDARDVMDRLDEVVGPENWQDSFTETARGRVICTLSIRVGEEWIAKSDGAGDTDIEGEKGGLSDSLKRAAVKWGIGRYLYNLKDVWAPCESGEYNGKMRWRKWKPEASRVFGDALRSLSADATTHDVAPKAPSEMPDAEFSKLVGLVEATKTSTQALCKRFGVESLRHLNHDQYAKAVKGLTDKLAKMAKEDSNRAGSNAGRDVADINDDEISY